VEVDLVRVILRIEKEFHSLIKAKQTGIMIRNEGLAETGKFTVKAEDLLIYSMMSNLIKNALEATPKTEKISVTLSRKETQAVICIHNQGSVPGEIKPVFFEKYTTSGKAKGSGIGTYSARLIARTLGGSIHMDSSEEQGTRISILLPD
jgi:signal transduction histidine kinase